MSRNKTSVVRKTLVKGDRVVLNTEKIGTIRYKGQTTFAKGEWYGIELDTPDGKHDGLVKKDMKRYFSCKKKHGVFVQRHKIIALAPKKKPELQTGRSKEPRSARSQSPAGTKNRTARSSKSPARRVKSLDREEKKNEAPQYDRRVSHKITDEDGNLLRRKLVVGDYVELVSGKTATIMYIGLTKFASKTWYGLELVEKEGKHDGYVGIKRYYKCKPGYGSFVRREKIAKCLKKEKLKARRVTIATKLEEDVIVGILMDEEIRVGKIRWQGNPRNVFGSLHFGIELRDGGGDNDGMIKRKRVFKTPPNSCVFVPRSKIIWVFGNREWNMKGRYPELPL